MTNKTQPEKYIDAVLGGRYEIDSLIGEGGMALVYKALDRRLNRYVAVKILREELKDDAELRTRFYTESHAVAMLSHPNIVGVYDVGTDGDADYIVMELISGITLRQYMDRKGAIDFKEVVHFSRQIGDGLKHAHEKGIIHRDIKPQNIMLLKDGSIKIADFGIATLEEEVSSGTTGVGSLNYIAPEQARGAAPDARGDIYSLGVTMYEMLSGRKPYSGDTPTEIVYKQEHPDESIVSLLEINPDIPSGLDEIVRRCMSPSVEDRFQSAQDFLSALSEFTSEFVRSAEGAETPVTPAKRSFLREIARSGRISFLLGVFGVVGCIIGVFALLWNFWLGDVFSPAERIQLPDFTGYSYSALSSDASIASRYNFNVKYVVDTASASGTVLSQDPKPGRSLMITSSGIDVDLTVSTGYILSPVPSVVGLDYREGILQIQNAGFLVEVSNMTSDTVEKNKIISISPAAGEEISAGSTVYVRVSSGTEIEYLKVPNVIGLNETAAITKLENSGLSYGGTEYQDSEYESGTVIAQSKVPFSEVEEYVSVTITVSNGSLASTVVPEDGETETDTSTGQTISDSIYVIPEPG